MEEERRKKELLFFLECVGAGRCEEPAEWGVCVCVCVRVCGCV